MEIVGKTEDARGWRSSRHVDRLQTFVEAEGVSDAGEAVAVAADETRERAVRSVRRSGDVVDAVASVSRGLRRPSHGDAAVVPGRVRYHRAAGIGHCLDRAVQVVRVA